MAKRAALFGLTERHWAVVSDVLKYIGPGLLVTVGFIDPGNWAANVAAGSLYGYRLLWMVSLSTLMLILLQHNAAHLGIGTGDCLAEAATRHLSPWPSGPLLFSAFLAAGATAMAELLGAAIALKMLFGLPLRIGTFLTFALVLWFLFGTAYRRLERTIIGFVSLIGFAFVFELWLTRTDWGSAAVGWIVPAIPGGSLPVVMSVLGAVVMPHNLFLHSEIIQSRQWQLAGEEVIASRLKFEFLDTLFSMGVGWAINSAMILVAAACGPTSDKAGTASSAGAQAACHTPPPAPTTLAEATSSSAAFLSMTSMYGRVWKGVISRLTRNRRPSGYGSAVSRVMCVSSGVMRFNWSSGKKNSIRPL